MFLVTLLSVLLVVATSGDVQGPLTKDFQAWLKTRNLTSYDFTRTDYGNKGSFGGFSANVTSVKRTPVIFLHGNSDSALHTGSGSTGWTKSIQYFLDHGYTTAELYATSWEDNFAYKALTRTHNCANVQRLRKFVEAVLAYTKAPKVSIVGHSMGVTLGRKVVKGGAIKGSGNNCDIGPPLTNSIDVFVGISGANYGLCSCAGSASMLYSTCSKLIGFYPGDPCNVQTSKCGEQQQDVCTSNRVYSSYLSQLNNDRGREGSKVYSIWSTADDLIQNSDMTWGRPTSHIFGSDDVTIYKDLTHIQSKDNTADRQFYYLNKRA